MIYDTVIIGGGPAGYTAALYCVRAGRSVMVLEKLSAGGQMAATGIIDNYPGFEQGIDGFELGQKMKACADRFGTKTELTEVTDVDFSGSIKKSYLFCRSYRSKNGCYSYRSFRAYAGFKRRKLIKRQRTCVLRCVRRYVL